MIGLVVGDLVSLIVLLRLLQRTPVDRQRRLLTPVCDDGHVGVAAAVIWAGGDLTVGERVLVFIVGGVLVGIDAIVVFAQVGRDFVTLPGRRVARNVILAPGGAAAATVVMQNKPPS